MLHCARNVYYVTVVQYKHYKDKVYFVLWVQSVYPYVAPTFDLYESNIRVDLSRYDAAAFHSFNNLF